MGDELSHISEIQDESQHGLSNAGQNFIKGFNAKKQSESIANSDDISSSGDRFNHIKMNGMRKLIERYDSQNSLKDDNKIAVKAAT